jgi:hypothetical protein
MIDFKRCSTLERTLTRTVPVSLVTAETHVR